MTKSFGRFGFTNRNYSIKTVYHLCLIFFFCFRTGFRPTKGGRLIRLVRRGMHSDQVLFPLGIESGIPRVRP
jgi:hypothetical protein